MAPLSSLTAALAAFAYPPTNIPTALFAHPTTTTTTSTPLFYPEQTVAATQDPSEWLYTAEPSTPAPEPAMITDVKGFITHLIGNKAPVATSTTTYRPHRPGLPPRALAPRADEVDQTTTSITQIISGTATRKAGRPFPFPFPAGNPPQATPLSEETPSLPKRAAAAESTTTHTTNLSRDRGHINTFRKPLNPFPVPPSFWKATTITTTTSTSSSSSTTPPTLPILPTPLLPLPFPFFRPPNPNPNPNPTTTSLLKRAIPTHILPKRAIPAPAANHNLANPHPHKLTWKDVTHPVKALAGMKTETEKVEKEKELWKCPFHSCVDEEGHWVPEQGYGFHGKGRSD